MVLRDLETRNSGQGHDVNYGVLALIDDLYFLINYRQIVGNISAGDVDELLNIFSMRASMLQRRTVVRTELQLVFFSLLGPYLYEMRIIDRRQPKDVRV